MNDEVVTRLYRCLVEELRRRGHSEDHPLKVSELYQELVPYRAVRSELGVELNADYEHAMLRLLAGERGLLRLEPPESRDELRAEVEAAYPFVGMYKKFSASNVWVSMGEPAGDGAEEPGTADYEDEPAAPGGAGSDEAEEAAAKKGGSTKRKKSKAAPDIAPEATTPPRQRSESDAGRVARRSGGGGPLPARAPAPVQLHRDAATDADPTQRLTHAGADCAFCGDELPPGRRIRFCPHCGGDQRLQPCPRCEAVLEREWRYCISCGHDLTGA